MSAVQQNGVDCVSLPVSLLPLAAFPLWLEAPALKALKKVNKLTVLIHVFVKKNK